MRTHEARDYAPAFRTATLLVLAARLLAAQGHTPEEAARAMVVPPGFTVELVAAEPLVRQPVAIDFDDRKRLWVLQYLQYPNPAGLQRVKVDRWSRTEYDRLPKPPPFGPRGRDRLTILLDSDGDGRTDTSKDFVTGLNLASGFAFGDGGVYVLNVPYLLHYPDRDEDDVPDSNPEVLVTGFGMQDAHSVANSLTWGPDGWLYGSQGSTVTSKIRGIEFEQGVWRYHPRRAAFELFCEGGGNSWGVDFNSEGELLYSTNFGGYVMLHGEQGAYYWKSFAKHGGLHNPYAFGYFDHVPHEDFQGGHVSVGGFFYTGDTFPAEYRGKYIAGDLLGHGVKWHRVEPRGSSFRSHHGGELLSSSDTWFAPTDVTQGPDGAVYVADWHDRRMAHPDPDAEWDRSNGRVFRIQAADTTRRQAELAQHRVTHRPPTLTLLERLDSTNGWVRRRAHRVLVERRDPSAWRALENRVKHGETSQTRLQALWTLYSSGGFHDGLAASWLAHEDGAVRAWVVRFLGDHQTPHATSSEPVLAQKPPLPAPLRIALQQRAREEPSIHVRSQLAASAQRFDAPLALAIVRHLLRRDLDADDPYLGLLLWWAVERHAVASLATVEQLLLEPALFESRLATDVVLPRLVKRWSAEGTTPAFDACARLIDLGRQGRHLGALLTALEEGLAGGKRRVRPVGSGGLFRRVGQATSTETTEKVKTTAGQRPSLLLESSGTSSISRPLQTLLTDLGSKPAVALRVLRIRALLGDPLARQEALTLTTSAKIADNERLSIVRLLTRFGTDGGEQTMFSLLEEEEAHSVRSAALGYLTRFAAPSTTERLLALYPTLPTKLRSQVRGALLSRKESTRQLLDAVARGAFDADEVSIDELRAVALHDDQALKDSVRRRWGRITAGTPEEKLAQMRRHNNDLRAGTGDARKGQALFEKQCGVCHKLFERGRDVGPDLTHANRQDLEFLLASIVDPSRVVRTEHLASVVVTQDGQVVSGLVRDQTAASITLADVRGELVTFPRATVREIRPSETSLMPENLLRDLASQELRDLFAYLQLKKAPNCPRKSL